MKTKNVILLINAIVALFIFFSCGNENPSNDLSTDNVNFLLVQKDTNLYPQQSSLLYLRDGVLNIDTEYQANFADSIVKLIKLNDSTLFFTTPNFSQGSKSLIVEIKGKQFTVTYNVLPLPIISNPESYVNSFLTERTDEINASISELEANSLTMEPSAIDAALYYIDKLKTQIASMSETELRQLATSIYINNKSDSTNINQTRIIISEYGKDWEKELITHLDYFNHHKEMMEIYVVNMSEMDGSLLNLPKFTCYLMLYTTHFALALKHKILSIELPSIPKKIDIQLSKLTENVPSSVKSSIKYQSATSETINYTNKVEKTFTITGIYRNINSVDANSKESGIISFLKQIGDMNTKTADANQKYIKEKPIKVPDGISSVAEKLSPTTDVSASYFSVENISNKDVELTTFKKSGNKITIAFNTNKLTEQSFSYDVKYTNKGISSYVLNFTGKVAPAEPFSIEKVSGDNQSGDLGKKLTNPIKVLVKDEAGNPFVGAKVNFTANNGGSVSQAQATTGTDGTASVEWTLGSADVTQTVKVTAFKADGTTVLQGSPFTFTATTGNTFTDPRDGHVYKIVTIGTQTWMAENLAYLPVPASAGTVGSEDTGQSGKPFYYVYDAKYGVLYNWNAALTAAPPGWHLPSDAEWTQLETYLGGSSVAGGKMKSVTGWNPPNTGATNSSCFTALPVGYRFIDGSFSIAGNIGYWWSSTEYSSTIAWLRSLNYDSSNVNRNNYFKSYGFSVRCLRD
jgi:uncharacterized protein (TIGR02145 family)